MTVPVPREGVERFLEEVLATEVPRLQRESDASLLAHQHGNAGADLRADPQPGEAQRVPPGASRGPPGSRSCPTAPAGSPPATTTRLTRRSTSGLAVSANSPSKRA